MVPLGFELPTPWFQYKTAFRIEIGAIVARQIDVSSDCNARSIQPYVILNTYEHQHKGIIIEYNKSRALKKVNIDGVGNYKARS